MKKFWIRMINVCVIVAALIGYSKVTLAHEQTDAAAKAGQTVKMRKLQQRPGRQAVPIQTESIRAQPPVLAVISQWK